MARKFSVAKCQAKYWNQPWELTFEQYVAAYEKGGGNSSTISSKPDGINICRIDTTKGWTEDNVQALPRQKMQFRKKNGNKRVKLKDLDKDK